MIYIKSEKEMEAMVEGGKKLAAVMEELLNKVAPGISTGELDKLAEEMILSFGGRPAFKGYGKESGQPFPATICASLNDEVVHGIPAFNCFLREGDIFKIDIGMEYRGMFTDMARTVAVGRIGVKEKKIIEVVKNSFYQGIKVLKDGVNLSAYSRAVQNYVEKQGFAVVRDLVGHGVGRQLHEEPQIPNYYGPHYRDYRLKTGMTLALEPMINACQAEVILGSDGWVWKTKDGCLSAHWENTVAITKDGVKILTVL